MMKLYPGSSFKINYEELVSSLFCGIFHGEEMKSKFYVWCVRGRRVGVQCT